MKMKFLAEILAFVISATSTATLEGALPSTPKEIVQEVESAYHEGAYDTFLKRLDEEYQKAGKAGVLRGVFESAKTAMKNIEPQLKIDPERLKTQNIERNKRLLDAISENPELEIVRKVDAVVFSMPTSEQEAILQELESLKYEIPENTLPTIKNKISALETEYYIKSLLLDIGHMKSGSPVFELNKKKLALTFEKFEKMKELTEEFSDEEWTKKISAAKSAFRVVSEYRASLLDLEALALGKEDPKNSVEEKIKDIMMDYSTSSS